MTSWLKQLQEQMFQDILNQKQDASYLNHAALLNLHGSGYYIRLKNVLSDHLPMTLWTLGSEVFDSMMHEYLVARPTKDFNLNHIGYELPAYLGTMDRTKTPWVYDLVQYEINKKICREKLHLSSVDIHRLQSVAIEQWEFAQFTFQPHLILQNTSYPIHLLSKPFNKREKFLPEVWKTSPTHYMFYQEADSGFTKILSPQEYQVLNLLQQRKTLGEVCKILKDDHAMQSIFGWFQQWQELQLIHNIHFQPHSNE